MGRDPHVCVMRRTLATTAAVAGSRKIWPKSTATGVLDTPIAENGFTGMAVGAAMTGLRPIVEGMNMGFLLLAFNQISNNMDAPLLTSGGNFTVSTVVRGPGGGASAWC